MIDRYNNDWSDIRGLLQCESLICDEDLAAMPEASRHDWPQASPQKYECSCVTVTRVIDRGRGEKPFEMRLAIVCGRADCELMPQEVMLP